MKDIIIVCAGSVAVEVYTIIGEINRKATEAGKDPIYNCLGFIDDDEKALEPYPFVKHSIIGCISEWQPIGNEVYALGVSTPKTKEKLVNLLIDRGCEFETIISPYVEIMPNVKIGKGCFITPYCICSGADIGDYVNIMGSMIGGGAVIGDYSTILGFANIAMGKLGKRVYVGSHSVVLDVKVGDDAMISVGSIVVRNVKEGIKVFGNPAKRVDW